jgi:hypothetical protein
MGGPSTTERLRRIALERAYLADDAALHAFHMPVPGHALWQAPLLATGADVMATALLQQRVIKAGELWQRNFDMSPHSRLLLLHSVEKWYYIFCRSLTPDEPHLILGPLQEPLVLDGIRLGRTLLRYLEFDV